ncbi:DUF3016 domain-containing protein [Thalassotalea crassostreae]|uniref:DUF3016 domain-containing protein n=1 Tax=Thalassotalea crassostreae TaxID=1763536 RepID=UPI000837A975|nr:DUF3016 domain-containing protein [Thalassotalea crassostreae]
MKKILILILTIQFAACSSTDELPKSVSATEGKATVTLVNPREFTDLRPGNLNTYSSFEQSVASKIAEALNKNFKDKGISIDIEFTDIDLAGETRFNNEEIRVLKDLYIPSMEFDYVIKDLEGNITVSDSADIKDMGYLDRRLFGREANSLIGYDIRMLIEYFDEVLKPEKTI